MSDIDKVIKKLAHKLKDVREELERIERLYEKQPETISGVGHQNFYKGYRYGLLVAIQESQEVCIGVIDDTDT